MASPGLLIERASTSGRPPLPPQSNAHVVLLRAASSFKEKSPSIYRSLSADGKRIYDSIRSPPEDEGSLESSPSSRVQNSNLEEATSTMSTSTLKSLELSTDADPSPLSPLLKQRPPALSLGGSSSSPDSNDPSPSSPPIPPPPSPLASKSQHQRDCSSTRRQTRDYGRSSRNLVAKEVMDTWDRVFFEEANTDVIVCTDDGSVFNVHAVVLMASSPILKCILQEQSGRFGHALISVNGVPSHAVRCFLRFLYSSRCEQADMEEFSLHLVVLAHAYIVPALKRMCTDAYELGLLSSDNVVDVLQVARLCDTPRLYLLCLRRIVLDFKAVARSDGWRIMRESEPALEQDIVEAVVEADTKNQDKTRKLEEDKVYAQLHDAMEALVHICRDGCRSIGPHDKVLDGRQGSCSYPACKGLESLVRHFAACKLKVSGGCMHCKRMWQLLELHSRMCTLQESCKVPLCRHFRERVGKQPSRKEEMRWKMLIQKVKSAKLASSAFSLSAVTARLAQV